MENDENVEDSPRSPSPIGPRSPSPLRMVEPSSSSSSALSPPPSSHGSCPSDGESDASDDTIVEQPTSKREKHSKRERFGRREKREKRERVERKRKRKRSKRNEDRRIIPLSYPDEILVSESDVEIDQEIKDSLFLGMSPVAVNSLPPPPTAPCGASAKALPAATPSLSSISSAGSGLALAP